MPYVPKIWKSIIKPIWKLTYELLLLLLLLLLLSTVQSYCCILEGWVVPQTRASSKRTGWIMSASSQADSTQDPSLTELLPFGCVPM